jgi:hypothetical protein
MMDNRQHIVSTSWGIYTVITLKDMVKNLTSAPTAQWHARWFNNWAGNERSRNALDLRSLGILLSFLQFPEQVKMGTSLKSSTRSSGPGGRAESGNENMGFWDGNYALQRNRRSQWRRRERGRWARLTVEIVVMDPYRRTVPDSYGATAIDRADENVMRLAVRCIKFEEETARRGKGKAKG